MTDKFKAATTRDDEAEVTIVLRSLAYLTNATADPLNLAIAMISKKEENMLGLVAEPLLRQFVDRAAEMSLHKMELDPIPHNIIGESRIERIKLFRSQILARKEPPIHG